MTGVSLDRRVFLSQPIAHRGLHDAPGGIVENTAPAFEAAVRAGYGIECDVRPAIGHEPVVFHDATLERLTGDTRRVDQVPASALARLRIGGTDAGVMRLAGMLDMVAGRVPVFVEIKSTWCPPEIEFLAAVARAALDYPGPVALMSFDPDVMTVMRELATEIPRGIVSGSYRTPGGQPWFDGAIDAVRAARLSRLLENGPAAPSFVAYEVGALPAPATEDARSVAELPVLAWTVRSAVDWACARTHADQAIFEGPVAG